MTTTIERLRQAHPGARITEIGNGKFRINRYARDEGLVNINRVQDSFVVRVEGDRIIHQPEQSNRVVKLRDKW